MQQNEQTPAWVADDWPIDFDFRVEVAEQQELLKETDTFKEPSFPTHSFEYDF